MYFKVVLTLLVVSEVVATVALWRAGGHEPGALFYSDSEVEARLNRRVGRVDMRGVAWEDAARRLATAAGAELARDTEDGAAHGSAIAAAPVDLELDGPPLSAALVAILPSPLVALADAEGRVRVARRHDAWGDAVVRTYDVGPIVEALAPGGDAPQRAAAVEVVLELLEESTEARDETPAGSVVAVGDALVVRHTTEMHRRVERFLSEFAAAAASLRGS